MAKFLITLPPMPKDKVKSTWESVNQASVGSDLLMERAFIDESNNQAICCWSAPDRKSIEDLFLKAKIVPALIREVVEYSRS